MSLALRERLDQRRAGAAALAAANLVVAVAALAIGRPTGLEETTAARPHAPVADASPPPTVLAASVHPLLATTSATTPRGAGTRRVVSTGYCLQGLTASGAPVGPGMVAMNRVPLGSRWRVHDGPLAGTTLEATDRIGHSTEFDIWFAECADAVTYGRRTITVEQVG